MSYSRWLILSGGVLLVVGLTCSLGSAYYQTKAMGEARKGVAILGPEKGTPAWQEKERHVFHSDWLFGTGLLLSVLGVVLQTWGGLLPVPHQAVANVAAAPGQAPDRTLLWNAYSLEVSLYKEYLKLAFKVNAFYYVGVGAILSFYATNPTRPLVWMPLTFLLILSLFLAVFTLYGAHKTRVLRNHIRTLGQALALMAGPEVRVLMGLLLVSALFNVVTAAGIILILIW